MTLGENVLFCGLLFLAGFAVFAVVTRVMLVFSPEESLVSRLWQFAHGGAEALAAEKQKPATPKSQVVWGVIVGIGLAAVLTYLLLYRNPLQSWLETHVQKVFFFVIFLVLLLFPLRSNKHRLFVGLYSLGALVAVQLFPGWVTVNLAVAAIVLAHCILFSVRTSFLKLAVVMYIMAWLYDGPQVWLSDAMHVVVQQSVLAYRANNLMIPTTLSDPAYFTLGLGDLLFPAFLVILAARVGQRVGTRRLYWAALIGYAVGLLAAITAASVFRHAQPALIYLMTTVIAAVWLAAWRLHVVGELAVKLSSPRISSEVAVAES